KRGLIAVSRGLSTAQLIEMRKQRSRLTAAKWEGRVEIDESRCAPLRASEISTQPRRLQGKFLHQRLNVAQKQKKERAQERPLYEIARRSEGFGRLSFGPLKTWSETC